MQLVPALSAWENRNSGASKPAGLFSWAHRSSHAHKLPSNINIEAANAHRIQLEAFWPAPLDLECDKAACIVKSFCSDGYLAPDDASSSLSEPPQLPVLIPKKIPKRIIQNAAGIAVFSCMRSGLWMTGSGGSGILIAKKSDGTWSPPSGIMLHTPTLSFIGVDMYDCVLVINNLAALESITRSRVTLGEDVGLTNGPSVSLPHADDAHVSWRDLGNTVLAYMKARGQQQAINLNGCILAERTNENERFYDGPVSQIDILAGNVARSVDETKPLFEVIKMAEGRLDFDAAVIDKIAFQSAPGDAVIAIPKSTAASPRPSFGIPKADDPDPYGVLALEMAGLEIREAGTRLRLTSSQFDFNPAALSPSSKFSRQSVETFMSRSNRASIMSSRTTKSQVTDACTQTDVANTPETTPSPGSSDDGKIRISHERMPDLREDDEFDFTRIDVTSIRHFSRPEVLDLAVPCRLIDDAVTNSASCLDVNDKQAREISEEDDTDDNDTDEAVVFEAASAVQPNSTQAIASRVIHAKGNVVTIPRRLPPPLPKRSPARNSRLGKSDAAALVNTAASTTPSLLRHALDDVHGSADTAAATGSMINGQPHGADESPQHAFDIGMDATVQGREGDENLSGQKLRPALTATQGYFRGTPGNDKAVTAIGAKKLDAYKAGHANKTDPEILQSSPAYEYTDNSVSTSHEKHTLSVYTGPRRDGRSYDDSSLTTPTSDRFFNTPGEVSRGSLLIQAKEQPERKKSQQQRQQQQKPNGEETAKEASQLSSESSQTAVAVA